MWRLSNTETVIFIGWNAEAWHEVRDIAHHRGGADPRIELEWHMKIIVDEAGEIIAKATDNHTLIGGHHRPAVAASVGKRLS